ncbi:MAG: tetratricopeptide repeat protein [Proteobacteria bacterium]|nr:tetratricopeptide repeat protein [Pseudomonadota bacterium]
MARQHVTRRLAAILAADVAGYSRLMGADEEGTLRTLNAFRTVIDGLIAEHEGRVFGSAGDSVIAEFASPVEAVRCAAEIQRQLETRNADLPGERRMYFRIGVNLGDVMVDGDNLLGDGVNVAARIERLAEPGGICIAGSVYELVEGKLALGFADLGEQTVKNIARPIRAYRVAPDGPAPATEAGWGGAEPLPLPEKPSIAVLPFDNMSGDREQEYFSDGITADVITALSRVRWFFVIARNSSFTYKGRAVDVKQVARELGVRYVLEGSVRKSGDRVRVTAQLIDGATGNQVWARRYDRELSDIFALQDEITETIVGAIEPELGKAERGRARSRKPGNLDAWDVYQRAMSRLYRYTREDLAEAQALFQRATALDADLGPAYSGLAEAYYYEAVYGFADSVAENRDKAIDPARRAVALDTEDAGAHCTLGRVHYFRREHDAAILELETALDLNPSLALAHYGLGAALVFSGRAGESLPHLETAIRLSPHDPNMGSFLVRVADARFLMRDYEGAVKWAIEALRQPNFQWSRYTVLITALERLGRADEAQRYLKDLFRQRPDLTVSFVRDTHLLSDPDDVAHYLDGLRKAGLPE